MTDQQKVVHVFKSSHDGVEAISLNKGIIRKNFALGYSTNIFLDTNILIDIEGAYSTRSRHSLLKKAGIIQLADLVKATRNSGIYLSPGVAYQEIPLGRVSSVERAFNQFVKDYLPFFHDDPNSLPVNAADEYDGVPNFSDLTQLQQQVISIPYASLLAANTIDRLPGLNSFEKFSLYFNYCADVLDMVSLKELTIARYAFAPEVGITTEVRDLRNNVRNNFFKLKKTARKNLNEGETFIRISMNGAMDLKILIAADLTNHKEEQFPHGLTKMDVWIATSDGKLFEFCQSCPGFILPSGNMAMARLVQTHFDIPKTDYWRKTLDFQEKRLGRRLPRSLDKKPNLDNIVEAAFKMESRIKQGSSTQFFLELMRK